MVSVPSDLDTDELRGVAERLRVEGADVTVDAAGSGLEVSPGAGLSQRALAERMGTTQSVVSRLEEGGGAKNRIARVAEALGRHLIVSFPEKVPVKLNDAVQVT